MREILFKAKRKDNNEWIYGFVHRGLVGNVWYLIEEYDSKSIEVIPETISQYTGLKDKNGKKIFENDVVKMYQMNFESEWEDSWGTLHHDYDEVNITMTMDFAYTYLFTGEYLDELEVIGNIFDEGVKNENH